MRITEDTQKVIGKYIRDKKYISQSCELKVSFQDIVILIYNLQEEYNKYKDPKIKKAIEELDEERFR